METAKPILFFDGQCNLCNGAVDLLFKVDGKSRIQVASLQGETAKRHLPDKDRSSLTSVVLLRNGKLYYKSSAVFQVIFILSGPWLILAPFWLVPRFFTNWIYDFVALSRYRIFGRRNSCRVPTSAERQKFLP